MTELLHTSKQKDPVIVVLQLTGGNDYINTVIPHSNPHYFNHRPVVRISESDILTIGKETGFHPALKEISEMYAEGNVAVIHGVGYKNSPRSHFRSMDIWHTCEPDTLGTEGWLGKAVKELDPNSDNVVTAVSIGPSLFRALVAPSVPVATVEDLNNYGLLTDISPEEKRSRVLDRYKRMYAPMIGTGPVMDFLGKTGIDAIAGADILNVAPTIYQSNVEYADSSIANKLKSISQIHLANLGTRVFYCDIGSFDTHSDQLSTHENLLSSVSIAVQNFFDDLEDHGAADNIVVFLFSEFGRRVLDNGGGTDHGAAGVCLAIGPSVNGGEYGEYPSLDNDKLDQGDLIPSLDFRGVYSTLLEDWLKVDPVPIVGGHFESPSFITQT